ncbi:MAG: OmpA family protein [Acidobacteria bacterium]|nr:OmpA family protein [Acidobacteriota bacterium]
MPRAGMTGSEPEKPPQIIRRVRFVERGHGGAWKVAFADFVTAMMALFLVLWLSSATQETKMAVASYFEDPTGAALTGHLGEGEGGDGRSLTPNQIQDLAEEIREAMKTMPEIGELGKHVEITSSQEGVRIELLEDEKGVFFDSAAAVPTARGREALLAIAHELQKLGNNLAIEGHTDARIFSGRPDYSNWELSTDRANAARRILVEGGVDPSHITQVRGFAAGRLRHPGEPEDPSNRRVSIIALYNE